jgi:hypothetical protein
MTINATNNMNEETASTDGNKTISTETAHEQAQASVVGNKPKRPNFTDVGGPRTIDPYGLPVGKESLKIWQELLISLDEELEEKGWGQPATLYALHYPEGHNWRQEGEKVGTLDASNRYDPNIGVSGIAISNPREISGSPVEALWGIDIPNWVSGLILAREAWTVEPPEEGAGGNPDEHLKLSDHPRRQEVRHLILLTRGGERHLLIHPRGQAVVVGGMGKDDEMGGLIPEVLARSLGLPSRVATRSVAEYLGCMTLHVTLNLARLFDGPFEGMGIDEGQLTLLRQLPAEQRRSMESDLVVQVACQKILQICGQVFGADASLIDLQISGKPEQLYELARFAKEAGEISWSHLVEVASNLLPPRCP